MKRINKIALTALCVLSGLASCETYKVQDPEMTAVSDFDGYYVCFAVSPAQDTTVYIAEITNDTYNSSDHFWITLSQQEASIILDAIRFKVGCNKANMTFACDSSETTIPPYCRNEYFQTEYSYNSYYSYDYYNTDVPNRVIGNACIVDGKITKKAYATGGNRKVSGIEFTLYRTDTGAPTDTLYFKGQEITGFTEDVQEYVDFIEANF